MTARFNLRFTRRSLIWAVPAVVVLIVLGALVLIAMFPPAIPLVPGAQPKAAAAFVAEGAYLAKVGDCVACHTAPGGQPLAGGLPLNTPFGTILASNITPDRDTGIGGWSEAAFARALRRGISRDGHLLYPAMPYNDYTQVSDADVHALKAYFDSLPPVRSPVHANQMPFPFNIRQMMMGWNLLFFRDHRFKADPRQSEVWNRGKYVVDGLGHCTACHSSKNLLGGDTAYLQGALLDGWYAPELSGNAHVGLGRWSPAEIAAYLHTGGNAHSVAAGAMADAVEHSTQYFSQADLNAVALYLHSLPGSKRAASTSLPPSDARMTMGRTLFDIHCAACHRSNGAGVAEMAPALAQSPSLQAPNVNNALRTILAGGASAATDANPTGAQMPGFAWKLSDKNVADIVTYARNAWGNVAAPVSDRAVANMRRSLGLHQPIVHVSKQQTLQ